MPDQWEYVELGRRFAIVIIPTTDDSGREFQAVWLKQLKPSAANWDYLLKEGVDFLDHSVDEEFLLAKTTTVDIAKKYAVGLSGRLSLRIFRIENDYRRGSHQIIEHKSA